jgi:hypothetical protein
MEKKIRDFLKGTIEVKKVLDEYYASNDYSFSYFEIDREEFLDVFQIRLVISESEPNGKGIGNTVKGLRTLVEKSKKSKSNDKILCVSIKGNHNHKNLSIYCDVMLTEFYGFIQ